MPEKVKLRGAQQLLALVAGLNFFPFFKFFNCPSQHDRFTIVCEACIMKIY